MAKGARKSKPERVHSAAVVKMKYLLSTGKIDAGFEFIYRGVLQDLELTEAEVEQYIEENRESLTRLCMGRD